MEIPEMTRLDYYRIVNLSTDLVCMAGMDGYFKYVNSAWVSTLGYTQDELLSRPFLDFIHPDDHAKNDEEIKKLAAGGQTLDFENRYFHKDGSIHHISWTATPVSDEKKMYCIGREITDHKQVENALKEREAFLGTLINAIPVPVFYKNRAGQYLGFNKAFESFFGETREHLIGKSVFDLNPKDLAEIYYAKDKELFEKDGKQEYESQVKNANGELRNVIFNKSAYTDNQGSIIGLIGAILDITDRKKAEDALKQNENRYKSAQRMGKVGNWEYDLLTEHFWGSNEARRIYGFDPKSNVLTIDKVENCIPERERVHQALLDLIKKDEPYDLEFEIRPITGPVKKIIKSIAEVIKNNSGMPIKVVGVIQDITDRRLADEELRESEEKYRAMMEAMEDPIYICSQDLRVEYVNPAMIRKIGHDATGESCSKAIFSFDKKCPWCVYEKIQKGESVFTEILNPKDAHTYHVSHSPIFNADNSISKMTIFRDITQRKHFEEEREKLIKELQNALAEIKTLSGLLPICSYCKKIRDDKGYWNQIESYIHDHSEAKFSHSICQECAKKYYPDMDLYEDD